MTVNVNVYHREFQALLTPGHEPDPPRLTALSTRLGPHESAGSWRTSPEQLADTTHRFRERFDSVAEPWFGEHGGTLDELLGGFEQKAPLSWPVLRIREHLGTARVWWDRYDARMALPVVDALDEYHRHALAEMARDHSRPNS